MTPWEMGRERDAKAWEKHKGCLLSYSHTILAWECWAHDAKCPAIRDGFLVEAPW